MTIANPFQPIMVARPAEWDLLLSYGRAAYGPASGVHEAMLERAFRGAESRRFGNARPGELDLLQSYGPRVRPDGSADNFVCPVTVEWLEAERQRAPVAARFPGARPAELDLLQSYGPAATAPAGDPVPGAAPPSTLAWPGGGTVTTVVQPPANAADQAIRVGWWVASLASTALGIVHGYRRNNGSVGWALAWGAMGSALPVATPALAYVQGFGKPLPAGR